MRATRSLVRCCAAVVVTAALECPAATFPVDSIATDGDRLVGDGACETAAGECTLRAALEEANGWSGPDLLLLPPGTFPAGGARIESALTLSGAGMDATTVANADGSGLVAQSTEPVALEDLTLASTATPADWVTLLHSYSRAPLALRRCRLRGGNFGLDAASDATLESCRIESVHDVPLRCGSGRLVLRDTIVTGNMTSSVHDASLLSVGIVDVLIERCVMASNGSNSSRTSGIIVHGGSMTIVDSTVSGNRMDGRSWLNVAGGEVTLERCRIEGNYGGGPNVWSGSLHVEDTVITDNSWVDGPSPWHQTIDVDGGSATFVDSIIAGDPEVGLRVRDGSAVLRRCVVRDNRRGGVVCEAGALRIEDSLLASNAGPSGYASVHGSGGEVIVIDSTISQSGGAGVRAYSVDGHVTLLSCTVTGSASTGLEPCPGATLRLGNTIVAGNRGGDYSGRVESLGWNIVQRPGFSALTGNLTGNLVGVDPQLEPLLGGWRSTDTHALRRTSPAIDAADPGGCTDDSGRELPNDQRGAPRHADGDGDGDGRCDIGAHEVAAIRRVDTDGDGVPDDIDPCPDVADPRQEDTDADGIGDACDCRPDDPGVGRAALECLLRVSTLAGSRDAVLEWADDAGSQATHDIARDLLSSMRSLRAAAAECVERDAAGSTWTDATAPRDHDGLYWLVRPRNECVTGTWGEDSLGTPRPACR